MTKYMDFSKKQSVADIRDWLVSVHPDKINSEIKKALKANTTDTELDFYTAMSLLKKIERDGKELKNNSEFVELVLGKKTFKKMATLGYIDDGGFYIKDNEIYNTCKTTARYKAMDKIFFKRNILEMLFPFVKRR